MEFEIALPRCALGPATITPEVAVEIRAAELAMAWQPVGGVRDQISFLETRGWYNDEVVGIDDEWLAGWLAYHILHDHRDEAP